MGRNGQWGYGMLELGKILDLLQGGIELVLGFPYL